jgi:hypothetical protein
MHISTNVHFYFSHLLVMLVISFGGNVKSLKVQLNMVNAFCFDNSIILLFVGNKHVILLNLVMVMVYSKNMVIFSLNSLKVFACDFTFTVTQYARSFFMLLAFALLSFLL